MDQGSRIRRKWQWRHRLRWVVPTVAAIRTILVAIGTVLAISLEVPWLRAPLEAIGFHDLEGMGVAVIVFILALIFFDVRRLVGRQSQTVEQYFSSPVTMFPVLLERVDQIKRDEDKVVDVIGVTLDNAWPLVKFWLGDSDRTGWRIRVCAMVDESGKYSEMVPQEFADRSRANLSDALRTNSAMAKGGRNVTIEAYCYEFVPGIHGCRLGNGDLFLSMSSWGADGRLDFELHGYHFIPCNDRSGAANAMRGTFEAWFLQTSAQTWTENSSMPTVGPVRSSAEVESRPL